MIEFPPVELPPLVLPTFGTVEDVEAIPVTARVLASRHITAKEAAALRRVVLRVRGCR